jgi:hypothetical protein
MADREPVLVKVLDAKSAMDLDAVFTGEVKTAIQVRTQTSALSYVT